MLFPTGPPSGIWRPHYPSGRTPQNPATSGKGENTMFGWLTVFAVLALCSLLTLLAGTPAIIVPAIAATSFFLFLFFIFLLTSAIRGRP